MASRVTHFEIPSDNPEKAAQFYTAAFGWQIQKWGGPQEYWLVHTGDGQPGIDGGATAHLTASSTLLTSTTWMRPLTAFGNWALHSSVTKSPFRTSVISSTRKIRTATSSG